MPSARVPLSQVFQPRHHVLIGQLFRFGVVGVCGFVVDTATVYALRGRFGLYVAGLAAFLVAGSTTWALNRAWTFRGLGRGHPMHRQWARFLAANALGFTLNRGSYVLLVTFSALCVRFPVLATAGGAVAGMGFNFVLSRRLVFT